MPNQPIYTTTPGDNDIDLLKRSEGGPLTPAEEDGNKTDVEEHVNGMKDALAVLIDPDGALLPGVVTAEAMGIAALAKGYAEDTGSVNSIVIAFDPIPTAADLIGVPIKIKVAAANTGNVNCTITGIGVYSVTYGEDSDSNPVELEPNDLQAGRMITVVFDGTALQMQSVVQPGLTDTLPLTGFRNLVIKNNASTPNDSLDVSADEIVLTNAAGDFLRLTGFTATVSIAGAAGSINRLDSGSRADGHFYIYAVADSTGANPGCLLSTNGSIPALSSVTGYDNSTSFYCLIGTIEDASAALRKIYQSNRTVTIPKQVIFNAVAGNGTGSGALVSLASLAAGAYATLLKQFIPPIAKSVRGIMGQTNTAAGNGAISVAGDTNGVGECLHAANINGTAMFGYTNAGHFDVPLMDRAGIGLAVRSSNDNAAARYCLEVTGWTW